MHHLPYLMKTPVHCFTGQGFTGLMPGLSAGSRRCMRCNLH